MLERCYENIQATLSSTVIHTIEDGTRLPRNFSFVYARYLIGSSMFKHESQIRFLEKIGVRRVINLMEEVEEYEMSILDKNSPIDHVMVKVKNAHPPTIQQMDDICNMFAQSARIENTVVVHCAGGFGRAGTGKKYIRVCRFWSFLDVLYV